MKPVEVTAIEEKALQQSIETIRTRIDALGGKRTNGRTLWTGKEPDPGGAAGRWDDPGRVRDIIQSTARLEIHLVISGPFTERRFRRCDPAGQELVPYGGTESGLQGQYYVLQRVAAVQGNDFRDAEPGNDENGRPDATFILTTGAGKRFHDFTSANIGKQLGRGTRQQGAGSRKYPAGISDQGRITGLGKQKATDLSLMLRTGALPASIHYLEERTVGPSLGADSIRAGVLASLVGMLAVMAFMLIYYRGAGINADLALFLNLVILLGFMGFTGSVLTLPGIAGVILTIGMGVDSNVLIFERIREELHAGKSPGAAVDQGFAHAWTTIIDTHVTTIVSAAFCFCSAPARCADLL